MKRKGNEHERTTAKQLSKWALGNKKKHIFWRALSSGAKGTQNKNMDNSNQYCGDIVSHSQLAKKLTDIFSIECKFHKNYNLLKAFRNPDTNNKFQNHWEQTLKDAEKSGRIGMMIFTFNYQPNLIMIENYHDSSYPHFYILHKGENMIMRMDEFTSFYDYEEFVNKFEG